MLPLTLWFRLVLRICRPHLHRQPAHPWWQGSRIFRPSSHKWTLGSCYPRQTVAGGHRSAKPEMTSILQHLLDKHLTPIYSGQGSGKRGGEHHLFSSSKSLQAKKHIVKESLANSHPHKSSLIQSSSIPTHPPPKISRWFCTNPTTDPSQNSGPALLFLRGYDNAYL